MKYIVAVSGGVDSVVLLDRLSKKEEGRRKKEEYIVAHVDHGMRPDSQADAAFVAALAVRYGLAYESTQLHLGAEASEAEARARRYEFLESVRVRHGANAIVTAHHQDDVIETMLINLLRGTGWRGLCSLREHDAMRRPLLTTSKAEIIQYALTHQLTWSEDSTNDNPKYLRNYVRQTMVSSMKPDVRAQLLSLYQRQLELSDQIVAETARLLPLVQDETGLRRYWLIMAGPTVAMELIAAWQGRRFETASLQRLWHFACTARPGKYLVEDGVKFAVTVRHLIVSPPHI